MKRLALVGGIVSVIGLSGCATTKKYETMLDSWKGENLDQLISKWGAPKNSVKLSDGRTVVEYISTRLVSGGGYSTTKPMTSYDNGSIRDSRGNYSYYSGSSTTYVTETTPTWAESRTCKTRFTISSERIIQDWAHEGNDCTISKVDGYAPR